MSLWSDGKSPIHRCPEISSWYGLGKGTVLLSLKSHLQNGIWHLPWVKAAKIQRDDVSGAWDCSTAGRVFTNTHKFLRSTPSTIHPRCGSTVKVKEQNEREQLSERQCVWSTRRRQQTQQCHWSSPQVSAPASWHSYCSPECWPSMLDALSPSSPSLVLHCWFFEQPMSPDHSSSGLGREEEVKKHRSQCSDVSKGRCWRKGRGGESQKQQWELGYFCFNF